MCHSHIKQLWKGMRPLHMLKMINLRKCQKLNRIPDFTGVPNLKELILEGCTNLSVIHPSLLVHKKLISLNLKNCASLKALPSKIDMESLQKLNLSYCSKLKKFPNIMENMKCLWCLSLAGTSIRELPMSVGLLTSLYWLDVENCRNLVSLPSTISGLKSLRKLTMSGCCQLKYVPENLAQVESLEELDLSGTAISEPMLSIFLMKNLRKLSFRGCQLRIDPAFCRYKKIIYKEELESLSRLLADLYSPPLKLPSFSELCSLTTLDLSHCGLRKLPQDFGLFVSLFWLDLSKNDFASLPSSISSLSRLVHLNLEGCKWLQSLPELPSNLIEVKLDGCALLANVSDTFKLGSSRLAKISCVNCSELPDCFSMACSMLKEYLKGVSNPIHFSIIVPGSKIPNWCSYRSESCSVRVERSPRLSNNRDLAGYVVCSVFVVDHDPEDFHRRYLFFNWGVERHDYFVDFEDTSGQNISEHLCLLYLSRHEYFDAKLQNDFAKLRFEISGSPGLQVKRCGVRPINEHEVETFNQVLGDRSNRSDSRNLHEVHDKLRAAIDALNQPLRIVNRGRRGNRGIGGSIDRATDIPTKGPGGRMPLLPLSQPLNTDTTLSGDPDYVLKPRALRPWVR